MDIIKTTPDLQFTVHYQDGVTRHINKGILFEESEDGHVNVHIGTDNVANTLVAIIEVVGRC